MNCYNAVALQNRVFSCLIWISISVHDIIVRSSYHLHVISSDVSNWIS